MSCCLFGNKNEKEEHWDNNRQIEKIIDKDKKNEIQVKVLLLGAGESGKSTFLKQMKIIHGQSLFDDYSIEEIKSNIYQNIVKGMKVLIDAKNKLNIEWGNQENSKHASHVFSYSNQILDTILFLEYANSVKELWIDEGIQSAFDRRVEFQISDGLRFLFDDLNRIATRDYVPSNQDILYSRKGTKSITEYVININEVPFKFIDVGGQRIQRPKWFQHFDNVTAVLFFVSSNEYDQVLLEDRKSNRLRESLLIFKNIINNKAFSNISFILFLNKTDLLEEKINRTAKELMKLSSNMSSQNESKVPKTIKHFFPEFNDLNPLDLKCVQTFIYEMFEECRLTKEKSNHLLCHYTTATDTDNITKVFDSVKQIILNKNLEEILIQ